MHTETENSIRGRQQSVHGPHPSFCPQRSFCPQPSLCPHFCPQPGFCPQPMILQVKNKEAISDTWSEDTIPQQKIPYQDLHVFSGWPPPSGVGRFIGTYWSHACSALAFAHLGASFCLFFFPLPCFAPGAEARYQVSPPIFYNIHSSLNLQAKNKQAISDTWSEYTIPKQRIPYQDLRVFSGWLPPPLGWAGSLEPSGVMPVGL